MSNTFLLAIPVVIALVAGFIGWRTSHTRAKAAYFIALSLSAIVCAVGVIAAMNASGWDGVGYLFLTLLGPAPATAALLIGGGIGIITKPKLPLPS